jgi:hypothetical protein
MQADQLLWFVVGGVAAVVLVFVMRLFRKPQDDWAAFPSTAADHPPLSPVCRPGEVPYGVDKRPMPTGEDLDVLLPTQVGSFVRVSIEEPKDIRTNSIYADYRHGSSGVFVELGICGEPSGAQRAIRTAKAETDAELPDVLQQCVFDADPSYLRVIPKRGAFFAWTRGGYYFSANTKNGEAVLDAFMAVFPY